MTCCSASSAATSPTSAIISATWADSSGSARRSAFRAAARASAECSRRGGAGLATSTMSFSRSPRCSVRRCSVRCTRLANRVNTLQASRRDRPVALTLPCSVPSRARPHRGTSLTPCARQPRLRRHSGAAGDISRIREGDRGYGRGSWPNEWRRPSCSSAGGG